MHTYEIWVGDTMVRVVERSRSRAARAARWLVRAVWVDGELSQIGRITGAV